MSWLSSWLNNEPARDAQNRQNDLAKKQAEQNTNLFQSTSGTALAGLDQDAAAARTSLMDLFNKQGGIFQNMLGDITTAGRNMAAQSGLIGGTQEGDWTRKAVSDVANQMQANMAGQLAGLNQNVMGQRQGIFQSLLGNYGQMANQGQQNQLATTGQYQAGPLDNLLGGIGKVVQIGSGIAGLFAKPTVAGAAGGKK